MGEESERSKEMQKMLANLIQSNGPGQKPRDRTQRARWKGKNRAWAESS